jgi:hypothetical protein
MAEEPGRPQGGLNPAILIIVGGGATIAGALLPWAKLRAAFVGELTVNGTEGDAGKVVLAVGAVIALLGLIALKPDNRGAAVLALIAGIGAAGYCGYKATEVSDVVDTARGTTGVATASVGEGIWIGIAGGVIAAIASLWYLNTTPKAAAAPTTTGATIPTTSPNVEEPRPTTPEPHAHAWQAPAPDPPPAPPTPPAGWYADPYQRFEHRWYDGTAWTAHVLRAGAQSEDHYPS